MACREIAFVAPRLTYLNHFCLEPPQTLLPLLRSYLLNHDRPGADAPGFMLLLRSYHDRLPLLRSY